MIKVSEHNYRYETTYTEPQNLNLQIILSICTILCMSAYHGCCLDSVDTPMILSSICAYTVDIFQRVIFLQILLLINEALSLLGIYTHMNVSIHP